MDDDRSRFDSLGVSHSVPGQGSRRIFWILGGAGVLLFLAGIFYTIFFYMTLPNHHALLEAGQKGVNQVPLPVPPTTLFPSNPFAANPSTSTQQIGPIPGSASVTGFILKTGMAWNLLDLIPADVTGWGAISPYVRMDIGMASLAATDAGNLTGHPYGLLVDGGAGIEWHVPSLSMGVFVEMDPSGLNANGSFLFLAPLVSGISLWF